MRLVVLALALAGCAAHQGLAYEEDIPMIRVAPNAAGRAAWLERFLDKDANGTPLPHENPGQKEPEKPVLTK